jgi:predicted nucleic acid-binding protein
VRAFVDTNVLVRHLTQDTPDQAARATFLLSAADRLHVSDVVLAEVIYVLQSVFRAPRERIAEAMRGTLGFASVEVEDRALLVRAVQVYELHGVDFADAYLVALAESSGVRLIASFDRSLDRVETVTRVEP